jgi:group II intron reverse transcriptase/maturase
MQTGELNNVINELLGIQFNIEKARVDSKVQNLASYINENTLKSIHKKMDGRKAKGVDGVAKETYSVSLKENVRTLVKRMKDGSYYPHPSRRTYIPKDGSKKMRPLGISCYEDKLVEDNIAQILTAVYEPKFYNCSFGFRPNRNCHQAVREIIESVQYHKVNYIVEADIKGFFDNVDHDWMIKFLEHDIADKKLIAIIKRFLKAGVMEDGKYLDSETGTPQGNGASPVLANIYLYYVLDMWFEERIKRQSKGEAYLIRYADDFVCCFQLKSDAELFYGKLIERFKRFGLELAFEKTKIVEFGRFATENRAKRGERKPETFDFLGFTFYCGRDGRKQFFRCKVRTSRKKFISKVKAMKEWIKNNRIMPVKEIIEKINQKLRGHYQYYGVTDNTKGVKNYLKIVKWLLFKWLNRRSQKRSYTAETFFSGLLKTYPLLEPKISTSLFYR